MNRELLIESILEYRKIGKQLMCLLGKKYGLDISKEEDYLKLVNKRYDTIPRNGELSKKWNYFFHGMECGFRNRITNQSIEVKLMNPPAFGVVEPWFLLSFLKSTKQYQELAEGVSWQQLEKILIELYSENKIEKLNDDYGFNRE